MREILAGAAALAATLLAIPAGTSGAQASADIMLLHGIPGIDVDVAVDGAVVIPGFEPGDMQDRSSFAGQTLVNLEVRPAGTEDVAIGPVASFDVPASGSWTVVAHLDADGTPTLTPFENDTSPAGDGEGRLTVRHTAAAPVVDIILGDARPVENLSNPDEAMSEPPEYGRLAHRWPPAWGTDERTARMGAWLIALRSALHQLPGLFGRELLCPLGRYREIGAFGRDRRLDLVVSRHIEADVSEQAHPRRDLHVELDAARILERAGPVESVESEVRALQ